MMRLGVGVAVTDGPAASGVAFSPLSLSPALWIDPSDAASVTISGSSGAYIGPSGLVLPSSGIEYASTPDSAPLQLVGDLDLIVKASMVSWTPAAIGFFFAKGIGAAGYGLRVDGAGTISIYYSVAGSVKVLTSTAATGLSANSTKWVRGTRSASTGDVNFYLSDDGSSWTQLGTTVAGVTGAGDASATTLKVGLLDVATQPLRSGTVMRVLVKNGIAGTTVFDADFASATDYASSFVESSSNAATVTVTSSTGGALVSQINDKSGNARHLTQSTAANMPKYIYDPVSGKNWLFYDGNSDTMPSTATFTLAQPFTITTVAKFADTSQHQMVLNSSGIVAMGMNNGVLMYAGSGPVGQALDTASHSVVGLFNGASSSSRVDAVAGPTINIGTNGWSAEIVQVGRNGAVFMSGSAGEIVIYTSLLSGGSLTSHEAYTKAKWGTP